MSLDELFKSAVRELRAKDLDDLQSIFATDPQMDTPYLAGQLQRFRITAPPAAEPFLPDTILQLCRDVRRSLKR